MEIFPRKAVEEARDGRDIERTVIKQHLEYRDVTPVVLELMSLKNRIVYPIAVASNSLKAHINHLRSIDEVINQPEA